MSEKIKEFLKNNLGYIIIGLLSGVYMLTAFLTISTTGKTVKQIILESALSFCLGVSINCLFSMQGLMRGEKEDKVQNAKGKHTKTVLRIYPSISSLGEWCDRKNEKNYQVQRTKILARVGLNYEDCFDEKGVVKPWKTDGEKMKDKTLRKIEKKKKRAFGKAASLTLTPLSPGGLTSEGGKEQDPFWLGRTKAQFETERNLLDIVPRLLIALVFGYYGVTMIQNFSYANLIWQGVQVVTFIALGVISMYKSYEFVVDEYVNRIVKKTDILLEFAADKDIPAEEEEKENANVE